MRDPFSTLGVPARFDLDPVEIERRYRDLQKALHPDRHVDKPSVERRMALSKAVEVNEAYRTLRDDLARAAALLAMRGGQPRDKPADPGFLMEAMERREALAEARTGRDLAAVRRLADEVRAENARARASVAELFAEDGDTSTIADLLSRMRYHRRFLDEVDAIEEDALSPPTT
jgi:molecular chaperone HscB